MKMFHLKFAAACALLVLPISLNSCTNYDTRAKNDAATGALMGAAVGAALGGDGDRLEGAAVGAAVGGAAGYGIGKARE